MAKFNEYSQKATPADNDTMMIYDATSKANKLSPFSGIWNWIVGKLTNAVISNLQTNNKTVLGAINELNSNKKVLPKIICNNEDEFKKILDEYSLTLNSTVFYSFALNINFSQVQIGGGNFLIEGFKTDENYEVQRAICYTKNKTKAYQRSKFDGTWNLFN